MAIIKPFKGVRPPQDLVEQVASRPYDVLNSEEARTEAAGNEKSLYHIIKPEIDFPVGTDEHDERVYEKAAENFRLFQDKGWLVQDAKENYYIYAQTMNGKTQYGLVVGAYVPDYMNGIIKKHELTRRDKEEDRMKHVRVNNANIEPVFFAYPDNAKLDTIIRKYTAEKPVYDFIAPGDGFGHTFWIVDQDEDIAAITAEFAHNKIDKGAFSSAKDAALDCRSVTRSMLYVSASGSVCFHNDCSVQTPSWLIIPCAARCICSIAFQSTPQSANMINKRPVLPCIPKK